jgi:hypothetical protein
MAPRRAARLPSLALADNLVRRRVLPRVFGVRPMLFADGAMAERAHVAVPTTADAVWALLQPLPTHYTGSETMRRALRRVVDAYLPFLVACARGEFELRETPCGTGVFAARPLAAAAAVDRVLPLPGLLTERLSAAQYDWLARRHCAFSVVQLARRRPLRHHVPIWRAAVAAERWLCPPCARALPAARAQQYVARGGAAALRGRRAAAGGVRRSGRAVAVPSGRVPRRVPWLVAIELCAVVGALARQAVATPCQEDSPGFDGDAPVRFFPRAQSLHMA